MKRHEDIQVDREQESSDGNREKQNSTQVEGRARGNDTFSSSRRTVTLRNVT